MNMFFKHKPGDATVVEVRIEAGDDANKVLAAVKKGGFNHTFDKAAGVVTLQPTGEATTTAAKLLLIHEEVTGDTAEMVISVHRPGFNAK